VSISVNKVGIGTKLCVHLYCAFSNSLHCGIQAKSDVFCSRKRNEPSYNQLNSKDDRKACLEGASQVTCFVLENYRKFYNCSIDFSIQKWPAAYLV
jgi:hypothetical protein